MFGIDWRRYQQEFTNSAWLIAEKLIKFFVSFLVGVLVARHLGPALFGQLNIVLSFFILFLPITTLGLNGILVQEIVKGNQPPGRIFSTAIALRILGALLTFICLWLLWPLLLKEVDGISSWWVIFLGFANSFLAFGVFEFWFQARLKNQQAAMVRVVVTLAISGFKVMAISLDASMLMFLMLNAMEWFFIPVGYWLMYRKQNATGDIGISGVSGSYAIELIKKSGWLMLSGVASYIYLKMDIVMLGIFTSDAIAGKYAAASRISEIWYFLPVALMSAFYPRLELNAGNEEGLSSHFRFIVRLLLFVALMLMMSLIISADWISDLLYGESWLGVAEIIRIHAWVLPFVFLRALLSSWLILKQLYRYSLVSHLSGAVTNLVLNLMLIPLWQGEGAAIASVISFVVSACVSMMLYPATRPFVRAVFYSFTQKKIITG